MIVIKANKSDNQIKEPAKLEKGLILFDSITLSLLSKPQLNHNSTQPNITLKVGFGLKLSIS